MHTFSVWAPKAHTVAVRIGSISYPLQAGEHGWWKEHVHEAVPGTQYWFEVDGSNPIPDPRSSFQPQGIHGPSQLIDHQIFKWTDAGWQARPLSSAILYELHIGTFTPRGTFLSAIECLPHLVNLGVTHVEIMPVNEFSGTSGWGYDGVDLYAPHHVYGTPDELKQLVDACHSYGLAVLLDVVYNHFGPTGNYLNRFGDYFTESYHTPWGAAVNLDHEGSPEVRRFLVDNALMWLRDYHFDGLRLDAVHAYFDRSAINFLENLSWEVDALSAHLGRYLVLIAESDLNDPRIVTPREAGGFGINAQWSDDFHHALHTVLTGENRGYYQDFGSLAQLAKALEQGFVYDGIRSPYRERIHGRPIIGLSGHHFLAYAQNHDQIGNRANGERLSHLVSLGKSKIAAALVLTSAFVPMLFQGEEFGASSPFQYFTHHDDDDLGRKVSEGRKSEFAAFGWKPEDVPDPQDAETFQRSKLRWEELAMEPHSTLLKWHRELISLRRKYSCLTDGQMENVKVQFDEAAGWLNVKRGTIEVICNLSPERRAIPASLKSQLILCSEPDYELCSNLLHLPPNSVAVLENQLEIPG
ncbi:MAG: malto-oligosyltrehalose trehalohydrolase [Acidobacteriaceae bacterium]|nr:malto-oligosyltrehalose trehalohydrolase [Acidobacteriaceae bacterium]